MSMQPSRGPEGEIRGCLGIVGNNLAVLGAVGVVYGSWMAGEAQRILNQGSGAVETALNLEANSDLLRILLALSVDSNYPELYLFAFPALCLVVGTAGMWIREMARGS